MCLFRSHILMPKSFHVKLTWLLLNAYSLINWEHRNLFRHQNYFSAKAPLKHRCFFSSWGSYSSSCPSISLTSHPSFFPFTYFNVHDSVSISISYLIAYQNTSGLLCPTHAIALYLHFVFQGIIVNECM